MTRFSSGTARELTKSPRQRRGRRIRQLGTHPGKERLSAWLAIHYCGLPESGQLMAVDDLIVVRHLASGDELLLLLSVGGFDVGDFSISHILTFLLLRDICDSVKLAFITSIRVSSCRQVISVRAQDVSFSVGFNGTAMSKLFVT